MKRLLFTMLAISLVAGVAYAGRDRVWIPRPNGRQPWLGANVRAYETGQNCGACLTGGDAAVEEGNGTYYWSDIDTAGFYDLYANGRQVATDFYLGLGEATSPPRDYLLQRAPTSAVGSARYVAAPDRSANRGFCSFYLIGGYAGQYAEADSLAELGHFIGVAVKSDSAGTIGYMTWPQLRELQAMGHEIIEWYPDMGDFFTDASDDTYHESAATIEALIRADKAIYIANGIIPTMLTLSPVNSTHMQYELDDTVHCAVANTFDYCISRPIASEGWCNFSPVPGSRVCVSGEKRGSTAVEDFYVTSGGKYLIDPHNIMADAVTDVSTFGYQADRWILRGHWANYYTRYSGIDYTFTHIYNCMKWCDSIGVAVLRPSDAARVCFYGRQAPPAGTNLWQNSGLQLDANRDSVPDGIEHGFVDKNDYWYGHVKQGTDGPNGLPEDKWYIRYGVNPLTARSVPYATKLDVLSNGFLTIIVTGVKPGHKYSVSWKERDWFTDGHITYGCLAQHDPDEPSAVSYCGGCRWGGPVLIAQTYWPDPGRYPGWYSGSDYRVSSDTLYSFRDSIECHGIWKEINGASPGASPYFTFTCPDSAITLGLVWPACGYMAFDSVEVADVRIVELATPDEGGYRTLRAKDAYFLERLNVPAVVGDPADPKIGDLWLNTEADSLKYRDAGGTKRIDYSE